jgi:hypothetical protein
MASTMSKDSGKEGGRPKISDESNRSEGAAIAEDLGSNDPDNRV